MPHNSRGGGGSGSVRVWWPVLGVGVCVGGFLPSKAAGSDSCKPVTLTRAEWGQMMNGRPDRTVWPFSSTWQSSSRVSVCCGSIRINAETKWSKLLVSKRWRRTTVFTHVLQKETLKKGILKKIKHTRHIHPSIIIHPSIELKKLIKQIKFLPPSLSVQPLRLITFFFIVSGLQLQKKIAKDLKIKTKSKAATARGFVCAGGERKCNALYVYAAAGGSLTTKVRRKKKTSEQIGNTGFLDVCYASRNETPRVWWAAENPHFLV